MFSVGYNEFCGHLIGYVKLIYSLLYAFIFVEKVSGSVIWIVWKSVNHIISLIPKSGDMFIRFRMWLLECSTVLLEAECGKYGGFKTLVMPFMAMQLARIIFCITSGYCSIFVFIVVMHLISILKMPISISLSTSLCVVEFLLVFLSPCSEYMAATLKIN